MNLFSDQLVLWVINVLIHSTVLTAVLLCVAMLFRKRAAMRYWILCCGLLLVLASPAVSAFVQSQGSGWLALALPSEAAPAASVAFTKQPAQANDAPMQSLPTQQVDPSITPPVLDASSMEEVASTPVMSKPMMAADIPANPSAATPAAKDSRSPMQRLAIIVTIATVVWAVGAMLLLMRMTIGWIRLAGILRRAEPITDPDYVAAFTKACALAGCHEKRTPRLVASDEISGPLAAGIFAGSVALPKRLIAESSPAELAEVLVHEVAHVVRRDQIVVLLQNLVAAIYWPHPLVRKLNRELAKAREEVCDNFVLETTDAPVYSRTLLSLAQLVQQPETIPGSVGFFASRWKLEQRVAGLLDETRDTQTILSKRGWVFVLASTVGLLTAISFGTVTMATAQNSIDESTAKSEAEPSEIEISGFVREQSGGPVGGAKIWLAVTSFEFNSEVNKENREGLLRELGSTDDLGRFDFLLDEATTSEIRERPRFARVQIVATSDGHGMDWLPLDVFQDDPIPSKERDLLQSRIDDAFGDGRFASRTLVIRPESQPVRGRLVDLEGNRLSNVTVFVESLRQPNVPQLMNALENAWKQGVYDAMSSTGVAGGLARSELQKLFPRIKTDENGEFQIRGIGDDQLATLVFQDERIEARPVHVVGREMETASLPYRDQKPDGTKDLFVGRDFNYFAAPSIPVEGTVTDYDTGKPIAGVLVSVERLFRREYAKLRLDTHHMRAVTDQQGRFRIIGMPPGDGHIIEAVPPKSEPYLPAPQEVSLNLEDGKTKRIEIQVKRGVWIEGRITDKESGEPRSAAIEYMAMAENPYAIDIAGWDPKLMIGPVRVYQRYVTDSDGRYRLPGLSGPGVLLVTSLDPGYPLAAGAETIDGYDPSTGKIPTIPVPFPASDWHLLKQINPAKDATSLTSDLTLDGGVRIPGRVVGPDGKPISNLYALGLTEGDPYWTPNSPDKALLTERFMVNGYDGKGPRQLFFKNQDETLVGQYRIEGAAPPEIAVKLEPSVRVIGRLIEDETGLPAARYFVSCEECLLNGNAPPLDFMIHWCHSDNDGEFEIKGLMAGHVYKMKARGRSGKKVYFTIDLTDTKPGESIEIGNARGASVEDTQGSESTSTMASIAESILALRLIGTVTDQSGKPLAGVSLRLLENRSGDPGHLSKVLTQTDANGRFTIEEPFGSVVKKQQLETIKFSRLVAMKDGYGIAVAAACLADDSERLASLLSETERRYIVGKRDASVPLILALPSASEVVRGRILDSEGRPVVGADVSTIDVLEGQSGSLDEWNAEAKRSGSNFYSAREKLRPLYYGTFVDGPKPSAIADVATDGDGYFEIPQLGDGRIADLLVRHPTIETAVLHVRSETGDTVELLEDSNGGKRTRTYYPNRFTHVAGATQPVDGKFVDSQTGEPIKDVVVEGYRTPRHPIGGSMPPRATRDVSAADGTFQLVGLPIGESELRIIPPAGSEYLIGGVVATTKVGSEQPVMVTKMPKGVLQRGSVVESESGVPVAGYLEYWPLIENPATQEAPMLKYGNQRTRYTTDLEGQFEIPVLLGKGILTFTADQDQRFPRGAGEEAVRWRSDPEFNGTLYRTRPHFILPQNFHYLAPLDLADDEQPDALNIQLDAGATINVTVIGLEGVPVEDYYVAGQRPFDGWRGYPQKSLQVDGYNPEVGRRLLIYHPESDSVAVKDLQGKQSSNLEVSLVPAGRIQGQIVDDSGEPITDSVIENDFKSFQTHNDPQSIQLAFPPKLNGKPLLTDANGRFEISGLMPGMKYGARASSRGMEFNRTLGELFADESADTGQTKDLGSIVIERQEP
ncbi:Regulatory protein BlaR1 [Rubripirellula lacrimiformis]|uniref:Regulatory protein BlaR1 n=1 Tax=Rubripirellula lacrimiformis TaxID=1930273 RepID=A0A517NCY2_9BACT|nr:M56 family metallopeptidase [Rubripirellula lacrimiformis]QDT04999.1 Regulatory protein BlaR1 [Rubripirellula lacrimiformis]